MSAIVTKLSAQELANRVPVSASWHNDYKDTSWVKILGLNSQLSEGDVLCVFSQFGEIDDLKLVRDAATGRTRVCFIKFEQFRSAWLTVDNFNDVELVGQRISVDHHRESVRGRTKKKASTFEERLESVQSARAAGGEGEGEGGPTLTRGVDVFADKSASSSGGGGGWRLADDQSEEFPLLEEEDERRSHKRHKKDKKKEKKKKRS